MLLGGQPRTAHRCRYRPARRHQGRALRRRHAHLALAWSRQADTIIVSAVLSTDLTLIACQGPPRFVGRPSAVGRG